MPGSRRIVDLGARRGRNDAGAGFACRKLWCALRTPDSYAQRGVNRRLAVAGTEESLRPSNGPGTRISLARPRRVRGTKDPHWCARSGACRHMSAGIKRLREGGQERETARPVSAPMLCLCKNRARRGLAARMPVALSESCSILRQTAATRAKRRPRFSVVLVLGSCAQSNAVGGYPGPEDAAPHAPSGCGERRVARGGHGSATRPSGGYRHWPRRLHVVQATPRIHARRAGRYKRRQVLWRPYLSERSFGIWPFLSASSHWRCVSDTGEE